MILNYGHTLGHAVEAASHYDLRHGEAVAIGLVFAAELAWRLGRIDRDRVEEHRRTVGAYDLPMHVPPGTDLDAVRAFIGRDKKAVHGVTWVLDGPNGVEPVRGVDPAVVDDAMEAVAS
jgi:5-deoxy-5-amino-3-dehydroquinate synthase